MASVVALRRWLWLVAALRLLSVVIGFYNPDTFKTTVFAGRPDLVNDLLGRLFGVWTTLTCGLCLICARDPSNKAIYGATLMSFVLALLFFLSELVFFKTVTPKTVASPMIVASLSTLWMGAGWNYYTNARRTVLLPVEAIVKDDKDL